MFKSNILFQTRSGIRSLLNDTSKKQLSKMVLYSIISGILDVFGIGALVLLVKYLSLIEINPGFFQLLFGGFIIITFYVLKNAVTVYLMKLQATFAYRESAIQSTNVLHTLFHQNELFFKNAETGSLLSDLIYVPNLFAGGLILGYISLVVEICVTLMLLLFVGVSSFHICLFLLLFIAPAAFLSYRKIKNTVELLGTKRNVQNKNAQDILVQSIQARTDVHTYDKEEYFLKLFSGFQNKISSIDASVYTWNALPVKLMEVFAVSAFCLIYIYTKTFNATQALPYNITLFVAAAFRLLPSVNRSLAAMLRIKNSWFAAGTLLTYKNKPIPSKSTETVSFAKEIDIRNLRFKYGEHEICNLLSFTIEKGKCIGIYGNTGEGKSTFLQLIMQLIPAESGTFMVDGKNVTTQNSKAYTQLFAYIKQDVFILNASLTENIALASEAACDLEKVNSITLELGLPTISHLFQERKELGEAGSNLSGGQKKLIALARALYFDKPVIVLDEALSAMDPDTLFTVIQVLKKERLKGKTIIIVSHQKKVFEFCDITYEFKNGTLLSN